MSQLHFFFPFTKTSYLPCPRTDINVGVIQITQTDRIMVMDFELISGHKSKLLENIETKKVAFQWRLQDLLSKFHDRNWQ